MTITDRLWTWLEKPETDQQRALRVIRERRFAGLLTVIGSVFWFCFFIFLIFLILSWVL